MRHQRRSTNSAIRGTDWDEMLETFLALDRVMVEVSMRLYKLPRRERSRLRGHNRRLHRAVRQERAAT